jgi:hypothetical protein
MKLPPTHGICSHQNFFIYAACDQSYFDDFGAAFINSIQRNTQSKIHIHLFNPTDRQLNFCRDHQVSITWETVEPELFTLSAQRWEHVPAYEPEKSQYDRTQNAMGKGGDTTILARIQKTYYACARFIRLAELCLSNGVFAVDIDAIVRHPIPEPGFESDFYLHHIDGKKARYLAGGIWVNPGQQGIQFLNQYAQLLKSNFEKDHVYWGLDQDVLDQIVPQFNHGQLPISYIDWHMRSDSLIWTAKGTRKELTVFINEKQKYTV